MNTGQQTYDNAFSINVILVELYHVKVDTCVFVPVRRGDIGKRGHREHIHKGVHRPILDGYGTYKNEWLSMFLPLLNVVQFQ
jgi:hypothetical protein